MTTALAPERSPRGKAVRTGPIVVGVGGHEPKAALLAARTLARHSGAAVIAVSVVEPIPAYVLGDQPIMAPEELESARQLALKAWLNDLVNDVRGDDDVSWRADVVIGDPARELAHIAARENAQLLVVGIGRHSTVDRLLQRETAIRALRLAHCPVYAVCGDVTDAPSQVVLGTDFSAECASAAEAAMRLMKKGGAISFVHAWQPSTLVDPLFADVMSQIDNRYVRDLSQRFTRLHLAVPANGDLKLYDVTVTGNPAEQLLLRAELLNADLVVVGRRGMNALERLLVGSVASAVIRHARCSVLVAPTPVGAELERLQSRVSGTVYSTDSEAWAGMLTRFTARNRGRPTRMEVDDPAFGAQTQEAGYRFAGAAFDHHDDRVELMLGGYGDQVHITRGITDPTALSLLTDPSGSDLGISIMHGRGQTLLIFTAPALQEKEVTP